MIEIGAYILKELLSKKRTERPGDPRKVTVHSNVGSFKAKSIQQIRRESSRRRPLVKPKVGKSFENMRRPTSQKISIKKGGKITLPSVKSNKNTNALQNQRKFI